MILSQIPGYDRAARRAGALEDSWRAFPFLGITEFINCGQSRVEGERVLRGVEVNLLTLRMFIELVHVRSPFLCGGQVSPEHIVQILWRLSPQFCRPVAGVVDPGIPPASTPPATDPRDAFTKSVASLPYIKTRRSIDRFIDRMLIDKPAVTDGPSSPADVSVAASFIHELAAAYGWSQNTILDLPMPALFQYLREINRDKYAAAGKSPPRFNPLRSRLTKKAIARALAPTVAGIADPGPESSRDGGTTTKRQRKTRRLRPASQAKKKTKSRGRGQGFTR